LIYYDSICPYLFRARAQFSCVGNLEGKLGYSLHLPGIQDDQ
jgi:hypothetical protein